MQMQLCPTLKRCGQAMRVLAYPGVEVGESNNPYTRLLYGNMRASVDSFSYSRAIRQRYDILHIHWPEWELNVWRNPLIVLSRLRFVNGTIFYISIGRSGSSMCGGTR